MGGYHGAPRKPFQLQPTRIGQVDGNSVPFQDVLPETRQLVCPDERLHLLQKLHCGRQAPPVLVAVHLWTSCGLHPRQSTSSLGSASTSTHSRELLRRELQKSNQHDNLISEEVIEVGIPVGLLFWSEELPNLCRELRQTNSILSRVWTLGSECCKRRCPRVSIQLTFRGFTSIKAPSKILSNHAWHRGFKSSKLSAHTSWSVIQAYHVIRILSLKLLEIGYSATLHVRWPSKPLASSFHLNRDGDGSHAPPSNAADDDEYC